MKKLSILIAIVCLYLLSAACFANAFSVGSADADAIVYNFRGPLAAGTSLSFTVDDFTVTATGFSGPHASYVNRSFFGLGVSSWIFDNPQIDGLGPDDLALLTFSGDMILKSAMFSLVGPDDDFRLMVDGDWVLDADIPHTGYVDFTKYLSLSDLTGSSFGFTVTGWNDDYMLAAIEVTQIPLPPAIILLSTGLMGLIGIRRRLRS